MGPDQNGTTNNTEVLDLTNSHLHNLDNVTISSSLQVVDLTANRLTTIDPRILALEGLRQINFRQNLLSELSPWNTCKCKAALEDLEFRDNQLKEIPELSGFEKLRRLEYSYNEVRSLVPLQHLQSTTLEELYVANNKVTAITGISQLTGLRILELGANRIRTIENLETLVGLEQLWLGKNRIACIQNLGALTNLRKISVQSNRLESMQGLEQCTALEELYLSHNGIWKLEGLAPLTKLKVLDVSNNRISKVEGLEAQSCLEDLWLNDNQIPSMDGLEQALQPVKDSLLVIYLANNPAASDPQYKPKLLAMLPHLEQIDDNPLAFKR